MVVGAHLRWEWEIVRLVDRRSNVETVADDRMLAFMVERIRPDAPTRRRGRSIQPLDGLELRRDRRAGSAAR